MNENPQPQAPAPEQPQKLPGQTDTIEPVKAAEFHKEASKISIEWVKQLITLSLGAIAFIVGFGLSHSTGVSRGFVFCSLSPFVISAGAGILFMMCFIGHVNERKSYNVYDGIPKTVALVQLLGFIVGLVFLGVFTYQALGHKAPTVQSAAPMLEITMGSNSVKHPVFSSGETSIRINAPTNLDIQIKPR